MKPNDILNKLKQFSESILTLGNSIIDDRLAQFEKNINQILPFEFKEYLKVHNGFGIMGTKVYGIGEEFKGSSLEYIYKFEHFEVENPMPLEYVPFSPDGQGNHYCLDLTRKNDETCPIIFWQHDIEYEDFCEVETCNKNFTEWVEEVMIKWTLEDYNFDGTEK